MALIKEHETKFEIVASYWKLGSFCIDTVRKEASFVFYLYTRKGAREFIDSYCSSELVIAEDKTLYDEYFGENNGQAYKNWQTACYEYAKKHIEFFKDAVDDEEEIRDKLRR